MRPCAAATAATAALDGGRVADVGRRGPRPARRLRRSSAATASSLSFWTSTRTTAAPSAGEVAGDRLADPLRGAR